MRKVLVTGANGQLGRCIQAVASEYPETDFLFMGREHLPINDFELVDKVVEAVQPYAIINTAAYTAVDKAETESDIADRINGYAVGNLAAAAKRVGAKFLHVSTDYVFNGEASQPYKEEDETDPINKYGASKLLGEKLAVKENPESLIVRTSWVYSIYGNNFVKTMRRLMGERDTIGVVNDQWGAPTYAMDLAAAILKIVCKETWQGGTYHFSNKGNITWYEFALLIKELGNYTCKVNPITTEQFPTPAKRPHYSVLDSSKIVDHFDIEIRDWKVALKEAMESFRA